MIILSQIADLQEILEGVQMLSSESEKRVLIPNNRSGFTGKSCIMRWVDYRRVESHQVFCWRLLRDTLPSREALHRCIILIDPHSRSCVFCFIETVSAEQLFFYCQTSLHFLNFGQLLKRKNVKKAWYLTWLATTWSIWRVKNYILFRDRVADIEKWLEDIIMQSWIWLLDQWNIERQNDPRLVFCYF